MISRDQAQKLAAEWVDSWNRHDVESILSHYADDVKWTSPFIPQLPGAPSGALRGRAAVRAYLEQGLARFPELEFQFYNSRALSLHRG